VGVGGHRLWGPGKSEKQEKSYKKKLKTKKGPQKRLPGFSKKEKDRVEKQDGQWPERNSGKRRIGNLKKKDVLLPEKREKTNRRGRRNENNKLLEKKIDRKRTCLV